MLYKNTFVLFKTNKQGNKKKRYYLLGMGFFFPSRPRVFYILIPNSWSPEYSPLEQNDCLSEV